MGLLAQSVVRTGKLEKASPLPLGRYWLDVFEPKAAAWQAWLNKAGASVHVETTEYYEGDVDAGYPARNWILFRVVMLVEWGNAVAIDLGWPNIASQEVHTSDDTVDKPDPEPLVPPSEWAWLKWAVGGTIAVAGLYAVAKLVRG